KLKPQRENKEFHERTKPVQQTERHAMVQRLLAPDDDPTRRELISQHPSLDWDQVVSTLTDRVRQEVHVSAANAQRMADTAILIAETTGSSVNLAKSLRAKANALYTLDQHSNAVEMHERAAA